MALNLVEAKNRHPQRAAVRLDDLLLTYDELDERSGRVAGKKVRRGVGHARRSLIPIPGSAGRAQVR